MNIAIVHEVSYTGKPVYEYQDFAERLAGRGHRVIVLDYDEHAAQVSEKPMQLSRTGNGEVILYQTPYTNYPVIRYLSGANNFSKTFKKILKAYNVDVLFLYSISVTGFPALRIAKRNKIPVVYRIIDAYHKLGRSNAQKIVLKKLENYVYKNVDSICSLNPELIQYIKRSFSLDLNKKTYEVVPSGVDTDHFQPLPRDFRLQNALGLEKERLTVLFLGTTYSFARIPELLQELDRRDAFSSGLLQMLIVGGGEDDAMIQSEAKRLGVQKHVVQTGFKAYHELPALMNLGDISITPFQLNDITRDIIPIKIFQYMSTGIPSLCTPLPDVSNILEPEKSSLIITSNDSVQIFTEELLTVCGKTEEERMNIGSQHRKYIEQNFSIRKTIDLLENLLNKVVKGTDSRANN